MIYKKLPFPNLYIYMIIYFFELPYSSSGVVAILPDPGNHTHH